jgi:hypothetical protein
MEMPSKSEKGKESAIERVCVRKRGKKGAKNEGRKKEGRKEGRKRRAKERKEVKSRRYSAAPIKRTRLKDGTKRSQA